jgi:hypothetical protein
MMHLSVESESFASPSGVETRSLHTVKTKDRTKDAMQHDMMLLRERFETERK